MKHIITFVLFAAPFVVSAQEQPASKKSNTPPTTEKSISEKGVSSTKSRAVTTKKTTATQSPAPANETKTTPIGTSTATTNEKPKD